METKGKRRGKAVKERGRAEGESGKGKDGLGERV